MSGTGNLGVGNFNLFAFSGNKILKVPVFF